MRGGRTRGQLSAIAVAASLMVLVAVPWQAPAASQAAGLGHAAGQDSSGATLHGSRAPITIAPGVTYQKIVNKKIPLHTYVLTFDPNGGSSLDAVSAGKSLPASASTASMLKGARAVAGINGDFLNFYRGSPVHAFAMDGDVAQTSVAKGTDNLLGITSPGVKPHVGETSVNITLDDPTHSATWPVDTWNDGGYPTYQLQLNEVAGFSAFGGGAVVPPSHACSVRLINPSTRRWADADMTGIVRDYTVDEVACSKNRMPLNGGIVLSALESGPVAGQISALTPGTTVSLEWSLQGWKGITETIGGNPLILKDGVNTVDPNCTTYLCNRNARAAVGAAADGTIFVVVVDFGHGSKGIRLFDLARFFRDDLGAVNALNLDGDGSSTMIVKGKTVNNPGDPGRHVSSALAILKGPDPHLHIDPAA